MLALSSPVILFPNEDVKITSPVNPKFRGGGGGIKEDENKTKQTKHVALCFPPVIWFLINDLKINLVRKSVNLRG